MALLKLSTAYTRTFKLISSTDHFSLKTGVTATVNISKAGAAFGAAAGVVTEVANGWYKIALTTADTGTLGDLSYYITGAGADDTDFVDQVTAQILGDTLTANATQLAGQTITAAAGVTFPTSVASPTNITAGVITTVTTLTNLPAIPANWLTAAGINAAALNGKGDWNIGKTGYALTQTFPANFSSMSIDASGRIDLGKWIGIAPNALGNGRVDSIPVARASTATAGTATTLTLDAGASAVDNYYTGSAIIWESGANIKVVRVITGYVGATKVATFPVVLPSAADATPTFTITEIRHTLPGTDGKALVSADVQDLSATLSVNAKNIGGAAAASATVGTVTSLTNLPAITANWLTAAGISAGALNGKGDWLLASSYSAPPTVAAIATGVWQDAVAGDFTTALSVGKSVMNGVALGTGLTVNAVTGLTASNLDTTVSSRMATYAQPAGFLAATFPAGTVASTTNITAGVITTATNLTNAPTVGDLTAAMKTSVTTAATAATPIAASVTGAVGSVTGAVASVTANVNADVKKINAVPIVGNGSTIPFNV